MNVRTYSLQFGSDLTKIGRTLRCSVFYFLSFISPLDGGGDDWPPFVSKVLKIPQKRIFSLRKSSKSLKGTVARDFIALVFFIKSIHLGP
jgi:hypothetical protein